MREVARAVTLLGFEELVAELGGDLPALAREVGIDLTDIHKPERFVSARKAHDLLNLAAERLRRKDLGLLWGARSDPNRLGPLQVALTNAATGRQAVEIIARFLHVSFPTGAVYLHRLPGSDRDILVVRSLLRHPPPLIQFYERRVGSLHVILRHVCGARYRPEEIWFSHQQNAPIDSYRRTFGVVPLFGMPENGIVVPRAVLDAVRSTANEQVREMAVAYLHGEAGAGISSMRDETFQMVSILMRSSNPTVSETARALGMHVRTLQRRLRSEGLDFEGIKDDVRRSIAETLLAKADVSMLEVALDLHYSSMSSFTRSCRRWFGLPPTSVRRHLRSRSARPSARAGLRRARLRS